MRSVDRSSRTPPWQQIAEVLRAEITQGQYGPDDRLPSVAEIAAAWSVNRKTANKALLTLAAEGLIEVEPGMGYYVRRA
jgi:GntR family transcriptional regulator, phosphonate transport system regulatory protein